MCVFYMLYRDIFWTVISFILFLIFLFFFLLISVKPEKDKLLFQKHSFEIDNNFLITYLEDKSNSKIKLSNIIRAVKKFRYYFLYVSQNQLICLSFDSFFSEKDRDIFESLLKTKKLLKN